ncbi:hypothetical protein [Klebsiella pneumoniae]|uniref:hypothetical protein n=1 Tax=Klebsiella pneumoniae TaxID=573 RepID=UPI001F4DCB2B|nr:hypothetical protein [Klebsiella pneumoniae]MCH9375210.1 hypothetical protein [Klebsiella pneumoniae]MCH9482577.1 hypothetical protein [Klebsiella pneumoniae]
MTDITTLAQREKFEAWVMTQICISKSTLEGLRTSVGYRNSTLSGSDYNLMWNLWKAASAELVEALEKAQETIAFQQGEIKALLSSLESRAVKLPPKIERNDIDGWFMYKGGRVGGGAAEWYNKALDDVGAELTAAGIKVEAE